MTVTYQEIPLSSGNKQINTDSVCIHINIVCIKSTRNRNNQQPTHCLLLL